MAHLLGGVRVLLDYGEDRELSHQMHSLSLHDQVHNYLDRRERCALPDRIYYSIKCALFLRLLLPSQVRGRLAFLRPGVRVNRLITFWR